MAITLVTFRVRYPEYVDADDDLLTGTIAALEPRASMAEVDKDELWGLKVADFLAHSPFARDLKLVNDDGESTYSGPLRRLNARLSFHKRYA
jgi:hypothetical protein